MICRKCKTKQIKTFDPLCSLDSNNLFSFAIFYLSIWNKNIRIMKVVLKWKRICPSEAKSKSLIVKDDVGKKNTLNIFNFYMDETALYLASFNLCMFVAFLSKPEKAFCRIQMLWRLFLMVKLYLLFPWLEKFSWQHIPLSACVGEGKGGSVSVRS